MAVILRRRRGSPAWRHERRQTTGCRSGATGRPAGLLPESGDAAVVVAPARVSRHRRHRRGDVSLLRYPISPGRSAEARSPLTSAAAEFFAAATHSQCIVMTTPERILIVAPSWVGDAILSEPMIALLRERWSDALIDVLAPPWCA